MGGGFIKINIFGIGTISGSFLCLWSLRSWYRMDMLILCVRGGGGVGVCLIFWGVNSRCLDRAYVASKIESMLPLDAIVRCK